MKPAPYEVNVSSPRGAPMGRYSDPIEAFKGGRVQLRRISFVDGDYDPGGAYWGGGGPPVWCAWGQSAEGEPIVCYFRAADRKAAKANLPKGTRFYRVKRKAKQASEAFFEAYLECALWSSTEEEEPLDKNHDVDDIAVEASASMRADCDAFYSANVADLDDDSQGGHDFWLTRNGHGAGFWDRGLGERGERLARAARKFGETSLYVGDDGKIYVDG